jgi:hypothetical protein
MDSISTHRLLELLELSPLMARLEVKTPPLGRRKPLQESCLADRMVSRALAAQ